MQTLIVHSRCPIFFWRDLGPRRAVAAATLIVGAFLGVCFGRFRDRNHLARADSRAGRNFAVAGAQ